MTGEMSKLFIRIGLVITNVLLLVIIYMMVVNYKDNISTEKNTVYVSKSEVMETKCSKEVIIDVLKYVEENAEYSIDGGASWQTSNIFKVNKNMKLIILSRNNEHLTYEEKTVYITSIDEEAPFINVPLNTTIDAYSKINLMDGVTINDDCTTKASYTVSPSSIDTSKSGDYKITYTATDEVGNTSTKIRNITINRSTVLRKEYRYRTISTTCSTCDNEPKEKSIKYTCASGYTLDGTKCISYQNIEPKEVKCNSGSYRYDQRKCLSYNEKTGFKETKITSITCPKGSYVYNNACRKKITIESNKVCPNNYSYKNGKCLFDINSCKKNCTTTYSNWSSWMNSVNVSGNIEIEERLVY